MVRRSSHQQLVLPLSCCEPQETLSVPIMAVVLTSMRALFVGWPQCGVLLCGWSGIQAGGVPAPRLLDPGGQPALRTPHLRRVPDVGSSHGMQTWKMGSSGCWCARTLWCCCLAATCPFPPICDPSWCCSSLPPSLPLVVYVGTARSWPTAPAWCRRSSPATIRSSTTSTRSTGQVGGWKAVGGRWGEGQQARQAGPR